MKITELFLEQLEHEVSSTRLALQRVPEGHNDWKPHEKSMPLGYLASLVATMLGWITSMVNLDGLDLTSPEAARFKPTEWQTRKELISALDAVHAESREALLKTTDEHLMTTWKFAVGGHVISENPRYMMIMDSVFSHLAHHRGQLTVYLRLNAASVPALYGPSADEGMSFAGNDSPRSATEAVA
jgi:uncharacterized damage-inducible protein DinB